MGAAVSRFGPSPSAIERYSKAARFKNVETADVFREQAAPHFETVLGVKQGAAQAALRLATAVPVTYRIAASGTRKPICTVA